MGNIPEEVEAKVRRILDDYERIDLNEGIIIELVWEFLKLSGSKDDLLRRLRENIRRKSNNAVCSV